WVPAASALCSLLSVVALVLGVAEFNGIALTVAGLGILVLMVAASLVAKHRVGPIPYKVRGLNYRRNAAAPLEHPQIEYLPQRGTPPVPPLARTGHVLSGGGGPRPMAIACCSGGGIRAAVWTMHMLLSCQREIPGGEFARRLRLIF